jgi:tripartite-type tricarboxylate transporter receptor subunit TctC
MKTSFSRALAILGVVAAVGLAATPSVNAQGYPSKPVRILVGFAPGGPADTITRLVAQGLSEELRQPFVVENRVGADGMIASTAVARSPGDGYTLLVTGPTHTFAPALMKSMPYDTAKDFVAVAGLASSPLALLVRQESSIRDLSDLIARARNSPGSVSYGTGGRQPFLAGELLQRQAGLKFLNVGYKGSAPLRTDLLGGQIDIAIDVASTSLELVDSGRLRVLAVASLKRLDRAPAVPTFTELGVPFDAQAWYGMIAPTGTPPGTVKLLNGAINVIMTRNSFSKRLRELGFQSMPGDAPAFQAFMDAEGKRWTKQAESLGILPQ